MRLLKSFNSIAKPNKKPSGRIVFSVLGMRIESGVKNKFFTVNSHRNAIINPRNQIIETRVNNEYFIRNFYNKSIENK